MPTLFLRNDLPTPAPDRVATKKRKRIARKEEVQHPPTKRSMVLYYKEEEVKDYILPDHLNTRPSIDLPDAESDDEGMMQFVKTDVEAQDYQQVAEYDNGEEEEVEEAPESDGVEYDLIDETGNDKEEYDVMDIYIELDGFSSEFHNCYHFFC